MYKLKIRKANPFDLSSFYHAFVLSIFLGIVVLQCSKSAPAKNESSSFFCTNGIPQEGLSDEENRESCISCDNGYELNGGTCQPITYSYICTNGQATGGEALVENRESCISCDNGYELNGETCQLITYSYICTNGQATEGVALVENRESCLSCDNGYELNGETCQLITYPYVCTNGLATEGEALVENRESCISCDNGYGLDGDICRVAYAYSCSNGAINPGFSFIESIESCISCDNGYELNGETCQLITYSYVCMNGTATEGEVLAENIESCTACNEGYILDEQACIADSDGDGVPNPMDVDDDNNSLIEIATREELENVRNDLAGNSYNGDTTGAPTASTTNCHQDSGTPSNPVYLCGYELAMDIDLEGAMNPWTPIGYNSSDGSTSFFTGIFNGNGYTISDLYIEAVQESPTDLPDQLGFFIQIRNGIVQDLNISGVDIQASYNGGDRSDPSDDNILGVLAASIVLSSEVIGITVTDEDTEVDLQGATTNDDQYIGGLVGFQYDTSIINNSNTQIAIYGNLGQYDIIGGLVGSQSNGTIRNSYAKGSRDGGSGQYDFVGGLVGSQSNGTIRASYVFGDIDGGDGDFDNVGGLVGRLTDGTIIGSYVNAQMEGGGGLTDSVGGLIGYQDGGDLIASYAVGTVSGGNGTEDEVGGVVGYFLNGRIIASYTVVSVNGGDGASDKVGKLVGDVDSVSGEISESYGFGTLVGENLSEGTDGSPPVTEASSLTSANAGNHWTTTAWDFGDSMQNPALKYVESYTSSSNTYSCNPVLFSPVSITCGVTLLPEQ